MQHLVICDKLFFLQGGQVLQAMERAIAVTWHVDTLFNDLLGPPLSPILAEMFRFYQASPGMHREYPPSLQSFARLVRNVAHGHHVEYHQELCRLRESPVVLQDPELIALIAADTEDFAGLLVTWVIFTDRFLAFVCLINSSFGAGISLRRYLAWTPLGCCMGQDEQQPGANSAIVA